MSISILYPPGMEPEQFQPIPEVTWHDLGFDLILPLVTRDPTEQGIIRYVMTRLSASPEAAQYRLDVFDDLIRQPKLREKICSLLARIGQLEDHMSLKSTLGKSDNIWTLMRRLREINEYIDCVETIGTSLEAADVKSQALKNLASFIREIREESSFQLLRQDIQNMRVMTSRVKSVTLGINLDENYETQTIGIISLNDKPFTKTGLLGSFTNRLTSKDRIQHGTEWKENYTYQPVDTSPFSDGSLATLEKTGLAFAAGRSPLMAMGLGMATTKDADMARNTVGFVEQVMNQMLSDSVRALTEVLAKYVTVDIHSITNLVPEFLYYVRWAEFIQKLQDQGYRFAKAQALPNRETPNDKPLTSPTPEVPHILTTSASELPTFEARGIYNMKLSMFGNTPAQEIVANEFSFAPAQNCYLLTGANRGGKTTITQAVGQAFILAQGGIYIPGEGLNFAPVDQVYTHFPADEDKTMDLGRLGEECSRFREIYGNATDKSLVLLNESFSTTSFEEGYYIAYDAVRALLRKGCRTIFNTHMHKLAQEVDALNADPNIACRAASLIVKNEGSKRSYRLAIAPPEGTSYAHDIAVKYGLTYEQLTSD